MCDLNEHQEELEELRENLEDAAEKWADHLEICEQCKNAVVDGRKVRASTEHIAQRCCFSGHVLYNLFTINCTDFHTEQFESLRTILKQNVEDVYVADEWPEWYDSSDSWPG